MTEWIGEATMTVRGHVKNGVVLVDGPEKLADGIEVSIRPLQTL
jgi:hypothetical protein